MFRLIALILLAVNCGLIKSQVKSKNDTIIYITYTNGVFRTSSTHYVVDCSKKYYFVAHGWQGSHFDPFFISEIDKLNEDPDNLSYYIDWVEISDDLNYPLIDTDGVGRELATETLLPLYKQCKTPYVYLISLSMGAHMIGAAGVYLQTLGYNPDVIMGCDPAGPFVTYLNVGHALSPNDAKQVVVIHTSDFIIGSLLIKGKVNFYFNGGSEQPGCPPLDILNCDHGRSMEFFNESISNPHGFVGRPCFVLLGLFHFSGIGDPLTLNLEIPESASGDYCLDTNAWPPYSQGPPQAPLTTTAEATTTTPSIYGTTKDDEYYWDDNVNPDKPL